MHEIRPNCEACDRDRAADEGGAMICTFERTFCEACGRGRFGTICLNCDGELVARPTALLERYPASAARIVKDHGKS